MREQKKKIKYTNRMRWTALLFVVLILFCGCTRKEELLALEEETFLAEEADIVDSGGEGERDSDMENPQMQEEQPDGKTAMPEQTGLIYVHVCGAVVRPGVYELKAGSRVYEAVQEAGGFSEHAEQNYVNQAQILTDGVKLVIPTIEEAAAAGEEDPSATALPDGAEMQIGIVAAEALWQADVAESGDGRININTASKEQLCEIPGIGETRAAAIAAYRDTHGSFQKPEDIMQVSGIKEGMYEKIKDSICVN